MITVLCGVGPWTARAAMRFAEAASETTSTTVDTYKRFAFCVEDQLEEPPPGVSATVASALSVALLALALACVMIVALVVSSLFMAIFEVNKRSGKASFGATYLILEWARRRIDGSG